MCATQASVCAFWISHSSTFKGFPRSAGFNLSDTGGQLLDPPDTLYQEQKGVGKLSPVKSVVGPNTSKIAHRCICMDAHMTTLAYEYKHSKKSGCCEIVVAVRQDAH